MNQSNVTESGLMCDKYNESISCLPESTQDTFEQCQVCDEVRTLSREWYILQLLLPTVAFLANLVTCYALWHARAMKFYLRVILLNLNITDLISCLVYLYHIIFAWNSFQANSECVVRNVIYTFTVILTLLTICCLSVDRCWSVFLPFAYGRLAGIRYVLGALGCTWAVTAVYVAIGFSFLRPDAEGCFYPLLMRKEIYFLYSVASLCVIILITGLNCLVYMRARIQISKIAQTLIGEARQNYLATTNLKATVTTLSIVVPFVLLNTPSYCLMLYFGLNTAFTKTSQALYLLNAMSNLAFLNSLINPAIYIWRSSDVRKVLVNVLDYFKCLHRLQSNNTKGKQKISSTTESEFVFGRVTA